MLCSELFIRLHSLFLQSLYQSGNFCHFGRKSEEKQIKTQKSAQKARHSVTNAGPIIIDNLSFFHKRATVSLGSTESPQLPVLSLLFLHELLGCSELMSHHAQELLALLQYIQVNQRNLHQRII